MKAIAIVMKKETDLSETVIEKRKSSISTW